ncbi:hypothetical protein TGPRC2_309865 [Toxoplasma gondii TgCatPRC2]|uniref:Uncharacterized protein n=10 Tax=Toxoplasma gondii TaxID=5811 RepID=S7USW5_TOXGG|nr:hypothetical protein TGGT1_309865 [Toxoplasma gondii GT1]KFG40689.1 hypothetical protein TGP89_309865 [Toxoplasma gondii p89]KFG44657.1 hypothetical protein TGDOM2_309865 [Toxoplasma gondii GAB2-2007-GAL-DOM2]KFG55742.1 hypothetical protein TGFOU_309865 [Toxoplasma gondii FOU]KFG57817.1 hypothetical protein TGRUB_309865 [Toxoplasma gondii RUB]KFH02481.1 hypothetical protein TGVAND_309865 [Toxoplasma gondii VAND]KFH13018.1 hypothetical protein TGMAS_309865 [Toxoplasma gondii MAS]KYK70116.1
MRGTQDPAQNMALTACLPCVRTPHVAGRHSCGITQHLEQKSEDIGRVRSICVTHLIVQAACGVPPFRSRLCCRTAASKNHEKLPGA